MYAIQFGIRMNLMYTLICISDSETPFYEHVTSRTMTLSGLKRVISKTWAFKYLGAERTTAEQTMIYKTNDTSVFFTINLQFKDYWAHSRYTEILVLVCNLISDGISTFFFAII